MAMNENDVSRKPWYRQWWVWIIGILLVALPVSAYQLHQYIQYLFYRPMEVTRGPWRVLDPSRPGNKSLKFEVIQKSEIIQEDVGQVVEIGDLVQISLWWRSDTGEEQRLGNDWWVWIGFRTKEETPFYAMDPRLSGALIGQKEGSRLRLVESPTTNFTEGTVYINPFGNYDYYSRGKSGYSKTSRTISIVHPSYSGYEAVYIKKVFKGQLKYRTTHLYDTTWFRRCRWFMTCEYVNPPREAWYDDARYDGVSADSQRATFQYGPVETPEMRKLRTGGGMRGWDQSEWKKLPVGVQIE
jgi:hypothetical protein